MSSTYTVDVMSIAAELAWLPAGPNALMTAQAHISPMDARQGSGVSSASTTFGLTNVVPVSAKRNRSFQDQTGPRVSWGTG